MTVSVVVICLNSERTITNCLRSLHEQEVQPDDIVVVDGGSKDFTVSLAHSFLDVRIIQDLDGNVSHGSNLGFHATSGDIIAFLDSDCTAPPHWVRIIKTDIWKGHEAIGGPYVPEQETAFAKDSYRLLGATAGRMTAQFARREDSPRQVKAVPHGNCAFSRELFEKVGRFDERLSLFDDGNLGQKIRATGARIAFVPEMWVYHQWAGWDGLLPLARIAYKWGKGRAKARRLD